MDKHQKKAQEWDITIYNKYKYRMKKTNKSKDWNKNKDNYYKDKENYYKNKEKFR